MIRTARRTRSDGERARSLAEVETLAWFLDNSIPVPGTGRRFGVDALIGFVPGVGDLVSAGIGLVVVWRGARMGLPRIVVARMLANSAIDLVVGSIPIAGDAFDLWFKASTRNLNLIRRWLDQPDGSTAGDWAAVLALLGAIVAMVVGVGWLIVASVSALFELLS